MLRFDCAAELESCELVHLDAYQQERRIDSMGNHYPDLVNADFGEKRACMLLQTILIDDRAIATRAG